MPDLTTMLIIVAPSGLSRKKFREFHEGVGIPEVWKRSRGSARRRS